MARYRATLLIERLSQLLGDHRPRIVVVPTWQDKGEFPQAETEVLRNCGDGFGLEVELSPIASFSWNDEIKPGFGVARLIERSISRPNSGRFRSRQTASGSLQRSGGGHEHCIGHASRGPCLR